MTREQCERKIAEYLVAIRLTMQEYSPDFDYLGMCIMKSKNSNNEGEWDCYSYSCNNEYYNKEEDSPINFGCHKDIKDEKYWKCITVEEDRETEEQLAYEGNLLSDGSSFSSYHYFE